VTARAGRRLAPLLLAVLPACAGSSAVLSQGAVVYDATVPVSLPPGLIVGIDDSGQVKIQTPDFETKMLALDWVPALVTKPYELDWHVGPARVTPVSVPPLMIQLEFKPRTTGFAFDPMAIRIRHDDKSLPPRAYVGPGSIFTRNSDYTELSARGCVPQDLSLRKPRGGWPELPARIEAAVYSLAPKRFLSGPICFVIAFDLIVQPTSRVEFLLEGISRDHERVAIPAMRLTRGVVKSKIATVRPSTLEKPAE